MLQIGEMESASNNSMRKWRFDIVIDGKNLLSIPNWLDLQEYRLPVIVSEKKILKLTLQRVWLPIKKLLEKEMPK